MILVRLGGETAVSVYGILMYAEGFIQPLLYGMCDSLQPAVGYNWGPASFRACAPLKSAVLPPAAWFRWPQRWPWPCFRGKLRPCLWPPVRTMCWPWPPGALRLFSLTYATRWFSFATQSYMLAIEKPLAASAISVSFALVFPVVLIVALWPLGLTGIWLNFAGTSALAGVLSLGILVWMRREWNAPDTPAGAGEAGA